MANDNFENSLQKAGYHNAAPDTQSENNRRLQFYKQNLLKSYWLIACPLY